MYSFKDELREALENCVGKVIGDSSDTIAEMLHAFNATYKNVIVTFSKTPAGATIVVKDGTTPVLAEQDGTYILHEKAYTYDATATGYISKLAQALVVNQVDVTAGTKTVTVELEKYCLVTFTKTPEGLTLVVKNSEGDTVTPEADGTYKLIAGTYAYDASADGYTAVTDQELVISSGDATGGTKTVAITLESSGT